MSNLFVFGLAGAIAIGSLTACGGNGNNFSMPANDSTKVESDVPSPIASAPVITPTKPAPVNLPDLQIKELEPFKHPLGIVTMEVPKGWNLIDGSQAGELLLTWNEQGERATISVNVFAPPNAVPEERLRDTFATIIKGMYGNQADFEMRSPVPEASGNVVIEWSSTIDVGNSKVKFQASSKLQRLNNKFVIFTFGAIAPKFPELKDYFFRIANGKVVNGDIAIP
ncbi:MAG: hypothetical protein DCE90_02930 [Pseudanabaena sp.]|nr:MAG: hypothetical protein DCE90_02930 [Pseudanabaena sp.]